MTENEIVPPRRHSGRHPLEKLLMCEIVAHVNEEGLVRFQPLRHGNRLIQGQVRGMLPLSKHVENQGLETRQRPPGLRRHG